jgi:glyceraldehyde-3-phosphate dehydrogenase/erythrose-4-phosphate dehydrogenase
MIEKVNIALFGFGRIGRNIFCLGYDSPNYWYDNEWGYSNRAADLLDILYRLN